MCEQTEINYLDGEVAWVKLGSCWWPGEVVALEKLPPDVLRSFRKPPIACVKFFQEDTYEYVKNINNIYKYNCSRKHEFINKGLYMFRTKHGHMEKFPEDVIRAETAVGGDVEILSREEFQEAKKESYAGLFGDPKKQPKGKSGKGRPLIESPNVSTPRRQMKEKTDYKVHILVQGSKSVSTSETPTSEVAAIPSTSAPDLTSNDKPHDENSTQVEGKQQNEDNSEVKETPNSFTSIPPTQLRSAPPSSAPSSSGIYACHACPFTTTRLNVLILHTKTHSVSFIPYTPSPVRKKLIIKSPLKSSSNTPKTPKSRKPRREKTDKKPSKKLQAKKRPSEEKPPTVEIKKLKTDEEIKSSLLADWDDVDDDSNDESSTIILARSPEVPVGAESPAEPTPAELPSVLLPADMSPVPDKKSSSSPSTEKPESSSDSKYEFCEDEDWPEEADFGRKIPRVKNPVRTEDPKSVGIDEDEVAREVAELLNKTSVPELPSVPEPLKIEENFPEPSIVKSPDKNQDKNFEKSGDKGVNEAPPTKAIFKTKTFFRSRHSRSQDAIGKYVAEQLNAVERMDISESEINGSEAVSSPEARDSPPIEPVKVARLAPKIQLKKMKAEAAQLREKEKISYEPVSETFSFSQMSNIYKGTKSFDATAAISSLTVDEDDKKNESEASTHLNQSVLYPTQEIKPVNAEVRHIFNLEVVQEQFTDKDAFISESTRFVKETPDIRETPDYEEQVVQTSQPEKIPKLRREKPILKEDRPIFEKDRPAYEKETPTLQEDTSTLEETPAFEEEPPTLEEETPILEEDTSTVEEDTSTLEDDAPTFEEDRQILKEDTRALEEDTTMFEEETTREEETPSLEEETPSLEEQISSIAEERPPLEEETTTLEETSTLEEEKSAFEEESSTLELSRYKETSRLQQPHQFDIETTIFEKETTEFQEKPCEFETETYEKGGEPTPKFSDEESSDFESDTTKYDAHVQMSTFEEETPVKVTPNFEQESLRSENKTTTLEEIVEHSQLSVKDEKIHQELHVNQESELKESQVSTIELPDSSNQEMEEVPTIQLPDPSNQEMEEVPTIQIPDPSNQEMEEVPTIQLPDPSNQEMEEVPTIQLPDPSNQEMVEVPTIQLPDSSNQEMEEVPTIQLPGPSNQEMEDHDNVTLIEENTNEKSEHQIGPYMNESTASAVDALLSVSREADRVPRVVTNDLPEDLFEDDRDTDVTEPTNANNDINEKIDNTHSDFLVENGLEEHIETEVVQHIESIPDIQEQQENILIETTTQEVTHSEEIVVDTVMDTSEPLEQIESMPSESDLQVAEALINLPSTTIQANPPAELKESLIIPFSFDQENSQEEIVPASEDVFIHETEIGFQEKEMVTETVEHLTDSIPITDSDNLNSRFETEQEKSENLNAAQSLVQMSESIEHKINVVEQVDTTEVTEPNAFIGEQNNGIESSVNSVEHNIALLSSDNNSEITKPKSIIKVDQSSSKLLKILEEPCKPRMPVAKTTPVKPIMQGKEKILNFDMAKSPLKSKTPKQKIIIRRTAPKKSVLNNVNELPGSEKIILSRTRNQPQESSSVQTFTIQTSPDTPTDANTIIIQQKIRKITKPAIIQPKLQKIKPQTSLVAPINEVKSINKAPTTDDAMFDINSMPIVLSEDLLTPESIEKMPVVMSDGNIISQSASTTKIIKPKQNAIELEKVSISSAPHKPEVKTLLLNPGGEVTKSMTPNILSKSSKLRGAKPMLVIDKTTGKQKIIMTKAEPTVKEMKQAPTMIQPVNQAPKGEKFIILPTQNASPRPARTQKIVIDPQTGKAHVFVAKGSDAPLSATENKPVSAKLVPSSSDASSSGNTVMIITNAQGAQSRIVLTPEHEKILFPNKQQPNVSQLKSIAHRLTAPQTAQKTLMSTIAPVKTQNIAPAKAPPRIVPKQKSAIITSKGQLIVGGRVATTAQNIAPMPELRPVQKRIVTSEPKKLAQAVQKSNSEPIIFLQQKSGAVMQLTAAQFEHLQRTGQIVQKTPAPAQEKILIQKVKPAGEPGPSAKSRARKSTTISPMPPKKVKHEIAIAPAPAPATFAPTLVPAASAPPPLASASSSAHSELDNFEELLPSTAIARQPEAEPPPAAISEQLLAVPGEHFGWPAGTFYLCVEEGGAFVPIDNRPLVLENNQLVPMPEAAPPERRDILEAALANSDVFHAEPARDEAPDFRDLNANVAVHCRVSETSTLHQPIMSPAELPSQARAAPAASLQAGLAGIGVAPPAVPTTLQLPITVTDPRIARDLFEPISMPLLSDEDAVGKSMPILTDEAADGAWPRRLLPPPAGPDAQLRPTS